MSSSVDPDTEDTDGCCAGAQGKPCPKAFLGFTSGYFAEINQGRKEVTEETAAYIAREAGLDEQEVLLKLARAKAKSETIQAAWDKLLQQYGNGLHAALFLAFMLLSNGILNFA